MENLNCNHCDSCRYCDYCDSCVNLKMTEYNYFCYAEDRNIDGYQRPRYQVFNKQLTEEEYNDIYKIDIKLEFDYKESYSIRYKTAFKKAWDKLEQENKDKVTSLPGFNREDFLKYYGVDIETKEEMTLEDICKELGRDIKIIK